MSGAAARTGVEKEKRGKKQKNNSNTRGAYENGNNKISSA